MKSLILIRHTKSDWTDLVADMDRPIRNDRKEDASLIAKEIAAKGPLPEYVICSPALRTTQTAHLLCKQWHYPVAKIAKDASLYDCTAQDILAVLRKTKPKYNCIAIVCHNPSITDFVNQYSDAYVSNMPTTAAVQITFDTPDWKSINDKGNAVYVLRPKEIRANEKLK